MWSFIKTFWDSTPPDDDDDDDNEFEISKKTKNKEKENDKKQRDLQNLIDEVVQRVSYDVIVYVILSSLCFELKCFHKHSIKDFYGYFDSSRKIFLIFNSFIIKLSNQLPIIPTKKLARLKLWKFYMGLPNNFVKNLSRIETIKGYDSESLFLTLQNIKNFKQCRYLHHVEYCVDDLKGHFEAISKNCRNLTVLKISCRIYMNSAPKTDLNLSDLKYFELFGCEKESFHINNHIDLDKLTFKNLKSLRTINLRGYDISAKIIANLNELKHLHTLSFSSCLFSVGFERLFLHKTIKNLYFSHVRVNSKSISLVHIRPSSKIEKITLKMLESTVFIQNPYGNSNIYPDVSKKTNCIDFPAIFFQELLKNSKRLKYLYVDTLFTRYCSCKQYIYHNCYSEISKMKKNVKRIVKNEENKFYKVSNITWE